MTLAEMIQKDRSLKARFQTGPMKSSGVTKKRINPSGRSNHVFLCCDTDDDISDKCKWKRLGCGFCNCQDSLDKISNASRISKLEKSVKATADKFADAVCLIQDSPFRILRVSLLFCFSLLSKSHKSIL